MAAFEKTGVELVVKGSDKFLSTMGKASSSVTGFGKTVAKAAAAATIAAGALAVGIGVASVKAAVSFESAFAGVIKTTDGLVDEMGNLTIAGKEMQRGFRDLAKEVPTAVEELLAIGELGGQLGIAKDDLIGFTETIAAMGESTDLTTEAAATQMAKLANVMGTSADFGVEGFERLGSSIVNLGNNLATTESSILGFAQRIAASGEIAGLTEAQVLGIGAAFSSVGIEAEAGGTAVSKVLDEMGAAVLKGGEKLEIFAATAGLTSEGFVDVWGDQPVDAFQAFVQGLGAAGNEAGFILDDLELKDSRLRRAFLSLANAGGVLTDAVNISNEGWRENEALAAEAEARYRTTESQFAILKNTFNDVAITIGQSLLPFLNDLLEAGQSFIKFIGHVLEDGDTLNDWLTHLPEPLRGVAKALGEVTLWLKENLPKAIETATDVWERTIQPALETFVDFVERDVIPAIKKIIDWLSGNFQPVIFAVGAVVAGVFAAWAISAGAAALATAAALAPVILLVGAVGAAVFLLKKAWDENWGGIQEKTKEVIDAITPFIEDVVRFFTEQFDKIAAWTEENWPLIEETISDTLGTISHIVGEVLGAITDFWENHGEKILSAASDAWDAIKWAIDSAINLVLGIIEAVMKIISGDWEDAWEDVKKAVEDAWGAIVEWLTRTAVPWLVETVAKTGEFLLEKGSEIIGKLWQGFKDKIPEVIGWFVDTALPWIVETVGNLAEDLFETAKVVLGEFWGGLKEKIPEIITWITDTAGPAIVKTITDLGTAFFNAGVAIVEELRKGLEQKLEEVIEWFKKQLAKIPKLFPFSEPKDPTSPLRNLSAAGEAIIFNIIEGLKKAIPELFKTFDTMLDGLFRLASGFASFGSSLIRMYTRDVLGPLKDALDETLEPIEERLKEIADAMDAAKVRVAEATMGTPEWKRARRDLIVLEKERLALTRQRTDAMREYADAEAKVLELQEKQAQLRFLQEQFNLLKLIREFGLDPAEVLKGIQLGLGASVDDLIAAMTRLLDQIVGQAESTLAAVIPGSRTATMAATTSGATSIANTTRVDVNMGGVTVNNEMDTAVFEERVRQIVTNAVNA